MNDLPANVEQMRALGLSSSAMVVLGHVCSAATRLPFAHLDSSAVRASGERNHNVRSSLPRLVNLTASVATGGTKAPGRRISVSAPGRNFIFPSLNFFFPDPIFPFGSGFLFPVARTGTEGVAEENLGREMPNE